MRKTLSGKGTMLYYLYCYHCEIEIYYYYYYRYTSLQSILERKNQQIESLKIKGPKSRVKHLDLTRDLDLTKIKPLTHYFLPLQRNEQRQEGDDVNEE